MYLFGAFSGRAVQYIAKQLAKKAFKDRPRDPRQNYGAGDLQFNGKGPDEQKAFGSAPGNYTEQQIIDWVLKLIRAQKEGSIKSIRLILFTMRAPCLDICWPALLKGTWARQIAAAAADISVNNVSILVFTQYGNSNGKVEEWNPSDPRNFQ